MQRNIFSILICTFFFASCSVPRQTASSTTDGTIGRLKFLDEYVIKRDLLFNNTIVGGLSGIDYDSSGNRYFLISDERSYSSPARFYTASIDISKRRISKVNFQSVHTLKRPSGAAFPSLIENAQHAPDPESIRYNPNTKQLTWTSEGDREVRRGKMIYRNPFIYNMDTEGNFKDSFFVPANLHVYPEAKGSRENGTFEAGTFTPDFRYYFAAMEHPIYEDGPVPTVHHSGAPVRFTKFDVQTRQPLAQYVYQLDAVAHKAIPSSAFSINGIAEILYVGEDQFLVLERSFSVGYLKNTVKIYLADFSQATDVSDILGLHLNKMHRPAIKKLLFNSDDLDRYIDNVEGITFGPRLPGGNRSLLLVADNNFSKYEKSQLFLFEILP